MAMHGKDWTGLGLQWQRNAKIVPQRAATAMRRNAKERKEQQWKSIAKNKKQNGGKENERNEGKN